MRLDDYTEGRFAEFPSGATSTVIPVRSMLLGLNGIWSDTDAAELLIDDSDRDKLGLGSEPWTGAGGPRTLRAYSPTAGGQGEYRTSDRYNARILTFPLIENTHNKAEKNKLLGLMWPSTVLVGGLPYKKLLAAGFPQRHSGEQQVFVWMFPMKAALTSSIAVWKIWRCRLLK